ncbi:hypothetical protein [uncultured Robinsoniella sp.]|uniref:hypothetical protein n=1 Tax=uncultured Robinsoniella sp. TaxID=904190 RepID=UPI00374FB556
MEELVCQNCNGKLKIDLATKIAVCDYCGTAFMLGESPEISEKQRELQNIKQLQTIGENEECDRRFKKLIKKYSTDYEILWEYVLYVTNDFNEYMIGVLLSEDVLEAQDCANKAIKLAPDLISEKISKDWSAYVGLYNDYLQKDKEEEEVKRKTGLNKIIDGDLESLDGFYFGCLVSESSYLYYSEGKLYLCALVRDGGYTTEQKAPEKLLRERFEVILDEEGFFMQRQMQKRWFSQEIIEERLILDGKTVQLVEVKHYDGGGRYNDFCTVKLGNEEKLLMGAGRGKLK